MHYTAERHPFAIDQLRAAEDKAKAAKKNIWKNYVESSVDETGDAFSNSLSLGSPLNDFTIMYSLGSLDNLQSDF